ncbi:hypothetical protein GCM10009555_029090 [Acrocarpospora macrocephala]|uniref:Schlafen AlbA-2 domain-containing protein n=1 Tax=Acrocarpospora macrocephala TaxID=150177 RepID=A0A5M3WXC4_9ACTN|nr:ATP-binding protein [Acrocarpospora macrocephala]GES11183.1 hypothetical protein Amac_047800 [Acrocarpospora macrocephala]
MMTGTTAGAIKAGIERFQLADRPDVAVLYPDVCFASIEAVGEVTISLLVDSVLTGWHPESQLAPFPVASLVVSRDSAAQFHPELSNRDPVEIQVWADGRVTVEVEFQGSDVETAGEQWRSTARDVLAEWARESGAELVSVFNDRSRSLPDVWNATFAVPTEDRTVRDLVDLGTRALRTAELSMTGWGAEQDVRRLLADGDAHAVLGWPPSAVLELRAALPEGAGELDFAADVCAFANGVRGGTIIVGVAREPGDQRARLIPVDGDEGPALLRRIIEERVFPVPERLFVHQVGNILVVRVPPQDRLVSPFLLRVAVPGLEAFAVVERYGVETRARSAAALHTALAVGTAALLPRD